jgi:hypothetical protein
VAFDESATGLQSTCLPPYTLRPRCWAQSLLLDDCTRWGSSPNLHDPFGKDTILKLVYAEEEMTAAFFEKFFSRDFDVLAYGWNEATVALLTTLDGCYAAGTRRC